MKTKILSILIVFFLILPPLNDTSARSYSTRSSDIHKVKAILRDLETGKKIELPVTIKKGKEKDIDATSFEVTIAAGLLAKSASHYDSTASIRITLSQYYSEHVVGDWSVSVDHYQAKWEKFDNTVTIQNAYIRPAVLGYSENNTYYNTNYTYSVGTPNLNIWYPTSPSWKGVYIIMNDFSYQAASVYSKLVRGGSSWTLQFCVAQGGGDILNCN
jgi:hypothetical protein